MEYIKKSSKNTSSLNQVYAKFIQQNKKLWDSFSPLPGTTKNHLILIDCSVDFPPYILGNLIIGKYIQKKTKSKIVGLVIDQAQFERQKPLLLSFSVEEVFFTNKDTDLKYHLCLDGLTQEKNVMRLRKRILDFTIDNMKVGDLIYDTYLRDTGNPTINGFDETLKNYFTYALKLYGVYQRIFHSRNVLATVQGHTVYLLYGMLARVAVNNGAIVFGRKPGSSPMAIRKYNKLEEFPNYEIGFRQEDYDLVFRKHREKAINFGRTYLNNRFEGSNTAGAKPTDFLRSFSSNKKKYTRDEFVRKSDLHRGKPNVFIMCHIFSDAPHMDRWMIHNDYFEWLTDTLDIVAKIPYSNWIVKPHPDDKHYNCDENHAVLETKKYMQHHDHIFLAQEDMNSSSITDIADAIVTVRGTAALEFTSMGIPCIVTGRTSYTSLGSTIDPKTRQEYVAVLKNIHNYKKITGPQIEKALIGCYCFFYLNQVDCVFIPSVPAAWYRKFNPEHFWTMALNSIDRHSIEDDPLFENLNIQIERDLPHLMKFNEL